MGTTTLCGLLLALCAAMLLQIIESLDPGVGANEERGAR